MRKDKIKTILTKPGNSEKNPYIRITVHAPTLTDSNYYKTNTKTWKPGKYAKRHPETYVCAFQFREKVSQLAMLFMPSLAEVNPSEEFQFFGNYKGYLSFPNYYL